MEDIDFKNLWNNYSSNLDAKLEINFASFKKTNVKKTRLHLYKLLFQRIIEGLLFVIFSALLAIFSINNYTVPQYLISGVILGCFSTIGAIGTFGQIILILRLNYSEPVIIFLVKLEKLKTYNLKTFKLLFLSCPFYFAYIIIGFKAIFNFDIYANSSSSWLLSNLVFSILLIPISIWLYKKLNFDAQSNWIKELIANNGGKQIDSSIKFINEIKEYQKKDSENID